MKRKYLCIITILVLLVSGGIVTYACPIHSGVDAPKKPTPIISDEKDLPKDSAVVSPTPVTDVPVLDESSKETYAISSTFEGESASWTAVCTVSNLIDSTISKSKTKFIITPKDLLAKTGTREVSYTIKPKNGYITGDVTLEEGSNFVIDDDQIVINPDETVTIEITQFDKKEVIELKSNLPQVKISAQDALESAIVKYNNDFGIYPTSDYTYDVSLMDDGYWIVEIEDNDNIGGASYVTVDSTTGQVIDMKTNE